MKNSTGYRDNLAHDIKKLRKEGKNNQAKGLLLDEKLTDEYKENKEEHKTLRKINKTASDIKSDLIDIFQKTDSSALDSPIANSILEENIDELNKKTLRTPIGIIPAIGVSKKLEGIKKDLILEDSLKDSYEKSVSKKADEE